MKRTFFRTYSQTITTENFEEDIELSSSKLPQIPSPTNQDRPNSIDMKKNIKKKSQQHLMILRCLLLLALVVAGGLSSDLSYYFIRKYQLSSSKQHFETMAEDHFRSIENLLYVQLQLNIQLATAFSLSCPSFSDWPNCAVPSKELSARTRSLLAFSEVEQFMLLPIVRPEDRAAFDSFAVNYYTTDGGYPNGTGISDFGGGIYDVGPGRVHLKSPNHTSAPKKYDMLVPVFLMSDIQRGQFFLANAYSTNPYVSGAMEDVLACVNTTDFSSADVPTYQAQESCSVLSDYPQGISFEYASIMLTPVFAAHDESGKEPVAFTAGGFTWRSLLSGIPHQDFNFQCSIAYSESSTVHTYRVEKGIASETGGIKHTKGYLDNLKKSFVYHPGGLQLSDHHYIITYYSSDEVPSEFFAIVTCACCVGVTLAISIIFLIFIYLTDREYLAANMLLDSKRTFVRFISHEIRTPLNTIILSIRLLSDELVKLKDHIKSPTSTSALSASSTSLPSSKSLALVAECLDLLVELEENSNVAVATLSDLINYDKIESKTFSIEKKDVNVWTVLEKTVQPLTLQAKEKKIKMELVTHLSDPSRFGEVDFNLKNLRLIGDSIKLGQVVRNLVSNALKFTPPEGEVKISARFVPTSVNSVNKISPPTIKESDDPPTPVIGCIQIEVIDSGAGLSLDQQQKMFGEGVQFNANELQAGQGSGLGMWISKEIVTLHDGDITVHSGGIGHGTTFRVNLPVVLRNLPDVASDSCQPLLTSHSLDVMDITCSQLHVLVVDDAISNRKLVSRLLQSKGFICDQAENGEECVQMILSGERHYDLILLDYEMPIMNGPTAARKLREMKVDTLIIGVTGNVLPEDKEFFIQQGANTVLTKPVNFDELLECLNSHKAVAI